MGKFNHVNVRGLGFFFFSSTIPIGIPKAAPIAGPKLIFPIANPIGHTKRDSKCNS